MYLLSQWSPASVSVPVWRPCCKATFCTMFSCVCRICSAYRDVASFSRASLLHSSVLCRGLWTCVTPDRHIQGGGQGFGSTCWQETETLWACGRIGPLQGCEGLGAPAVVVAGLHPGNSPRSSFIGRILTVGRRPLHQIADQSRFCWSPLIKQHTADGAYYGRHCQTQHRRYIWRRYHRRHICQGCAWSSGAYFPALL